jgi:hypothetical protein
VDNRFMKTIATMIFASALTGCAGFPTIEEERQDASSGFIGCAPAEIQINEQARNTWAATCKARVFQCTVAPSLSCTERIK